MAGEMSNRTLDREVKKVTNAYRRKLITKSATSSSCKEEEEEDKDKGSEKPGSPDETGLLAKGKEEEVSGSGGQTSSDHQGALTQAEVESAMTVVRVLPVVECFCVCGWVEGCVSESVCVCVCVCARVRAWVCVYSPFLTGHMFVRLNILQTLQQTMIGFLIELLVRRIWFGQSKLFFILNWLVMRCKLRPKLAADAQQTA